MQSTLDRAGHLMDADLVRVVDGMEDTNGASPIAAHLLECSVCAARLTTVQSRLARLTVVLRDADRAIGATSAPRVSMETLNERAAARRLSQANRIAYARPHRWLGAAAAVLLFAGAAAAAVPALRGWVAARWTQIATSRTTTRATPLISESPPTQAQQSGAVVSFHPLGSELVIRFDKSPAGGVLVLSSVVGMGSTVASAEIVSGGASDGASDGASGELLVLPRELRILNSANSTADYHVALPASVHSVRVVFGHSASERGSVVALPASAHEEISLGARQLR